MAAPTLGPCNQWITPEDVLVCAPGLADPVNNEQLLRAITFSTNILFRLSGRQFPGECTRTVRPCFGDNCGCGGQGWMQWPLGGWSFWVWDQAAAGWAFPSLPYRIDGQWFNLNQGCCGGMCDLDSVLLPAPASLTEATAQVVIDGVVLDPSAYGIQEYRRIVRLDGGHWPCTNAMAVDSSPYVGLNDGSKDYTWQITYTYGRGPGADGEIAAARFAGEMAKFLCNAADCQLPQRVKHIVREGVDLDFMDPMQFLTDGKVGIYEVDLWLATVNPNGLARRAAVRRLDAPRRYRGRTS